MYKKVKFYQFSLPQFPVSDSLPRSPYEHENNVGAYDLVPPATPIGFEERLSEFPAAVMWHRPSKRVVDFYLDKSATPHKVRVRIPRANNPMQDLTAHGAECARQDEQPTYTWIETTEGRFEYVGLKPDASAPPPGCRDIVCPRLYRQVETSKEHLLRWYAPWPLDYERGIAPWRIYRCMKHAGFRSELEWHILMNRAKRWSDIGGVSAFARYYNAGHPYAATAAMVLTDAFTLACLGFFFPLNVLAYLHTLPIWFQRRQAAARNQPHKDDEIL